MKIQHFVAATFGLLVLATAAPSSAYYTTSQSAKTFADGTTLFTITYNFGSPKYDIALPIGALRDSGATSTTTLGYELLTSTGSSTKTGTMTGLVLSNATIKDNRYFVPAGTSASFTLLAVVATPGTVAVPHKLHVTSLPFTFINHGTASEQHLNPSELTYYTTPLSLSTTPHQGAAAVTITH